MKRILFFLLIASHTSVSAQKLKKNDKLTLDALKTHITYLSSDKLEGRRTGTPGEKLAYEYIGAEFTKIGLIPKGNKGTFLQEFEVNDGKMVSKSSHLIINENDLVLNKDYFPLCCSPNTSIEATAAIALQESNAPWFLDIKEMLEEGKGNPHFELTQALQQKANSIAKKGATALLIYNTSSIKDELQFDSKANPVTTPIPVLYITSDARAKYLSDETAMQDIKLKVDITDKKRYGHNVIGYIDNAAATTVIIGAHYDHLGYGEDNNSLSPGIKAIHNGADDNASGTAALIELAKMLKISKLKKNNYLLIAFSGEESGLLGSKYYAENATIDIATTNYMVNIDMIGRVNDSTHKLIIGGFGTSPSWSKIITTKNEYLSIKTDSTGAGPSDHTSFYRKNIPVLFFFSGLHSDYHKPSDDAEKINYTGELMVIKYIYNVINLANTQPKLSFTKTREIATASGTGLKVTLGILPDYSFSGNGVRVDAVSDGRPAQKAGIKSGDILIQLGDYSFNNIQSYMDALNKFNKGEKTKVKLKRGAEELSFDIVF